MGVEALLGALRGAGHLKGRGWRPGPVVLSTLMAHGPYVSPHWGAGQVVCLYCPSPLGKRTAHIVA